MALDAAQHGTTALHGGARTAARAGKEQDPGERSDGAVAQILQYVRLCGSFFTNFSEEVLEEICQTLEYRTAQAGDVLIRDGAAADEMIWLLAGRVKVSRTDFSDDSGPWSGGRNSTLSCPEEDKAGEDELESSAPPRRDSRFPTWKSAVKSINSSKSTDKRVSSPAVGEVETGSRRRQGLAGSAMMTKIGKLLSAPKHRTTFLVEQNEVPQPQRTLRPSQMTRTDSVKPDATLHNRLSKPVMDLICVLAENGPDIQDPNSTSNSFFNFGASLKSTGSALASSVKTKNISVEVPYIPFGKVFDEFGERVQEELVRRGVASPSSQQEPMKSSPGSPKGSEKAKGKSFSDVVREVVVNAPHDRSSSSPTKGGGPDSIRCSHSGKHSSRAGGQASSTEASAPGSASIISKQKSQMSIDMHKAAEADASTNLTTTIVRAGQMLGVRACLQNQPHDATAVALEPCELFVLHVDDVRMFVEAERRERRAQRELAVLNAGSALRTLDGDKLERLAECFKSSKHRRGTVLAYEGEDRAGHSDNDRLQIIADGHARAVRAQSETGRSQDFSHSPGRMKTASASVTLKFQEVGTVGRGHIINGTSQLLGKPEPFTVIVESAEMTVVSAARTDLARFAGLGVLDGLRSAAEDLGNWHLQRTDNLQKGLQLQSSIQQRSLKSQDDDSVGDLLHPEFLGRSTALIHVSGMTAEGVEAALAEVPTVPRGRPLRSQNRPRVARQVTPRPPSTPPPPPVKPPPVCKPSPGTAQEHENDVLRKEQAVSVLDRIKVQTSPSNESDSAPLFSLSPVGRRRPNALTLEDASTEGTASRPQTATSAVLWPHSSARARTASTGKDKTMLPEEIAVLEALGELSKRPTIAACIGQFYEREQREEAIIPSHLEKIESRGEKMHVVHVGPIDPLHIKSCVPEALLDDNSSMPGTARTMPPTQRSTITLATPLATSHWLGFGTPRKRPVSRRRKDMETTLDPRQGSPEDLFVTGFGPDSQFQTEFDMQDGEHGDVDCADDGDDQEKRATQGVLSLGRELLSAGMSTSCSIVEVDENQLEENDTVAPDWLFSSPLAARRSSVSGVAGRRGSMSEPAASQAAVGRARRGSISELSAAGLAQPELAAQSESRPTSSQEVPGPSPPRLDELDELSEALNLVGAMHTGLLGNPSYRRPASRLAASGVDGMDTSASGSATVTGDVIGDSTMSNLSTALEDLSMWDQMCSVMSSGPLDSIMSVNPPRTPLRHKKSRAVTGSTHSRSMTARSRALTQQRTISDASLRPNTASSTSADTTRRSASAWRRLRPVEEPGHRAQVAMAGALFVSSIDHILDKTPKITKPREPKPQMPLFMRYRRQASNVVAG